MNKMWMAGVAVAVLGAAAVWRFGPARTGHEQAGAVAGSASAPAGAASGAAPSVSVTTVRVQQRDYEVQLEASGTVAAISSVELRPQVSSVIRQVHIREGQFVKAGQLLFTLDVRADEANVNRAKAQLARDLATLADAQRQLARSRELLAQNFVSQGAVDTNQTLVDTQSSLVNSDRAAIETARVALGYGSVRAPAAGRAGAVNVFAGSSVQANTTALVTITQLDPVLVGFNLPQRHVGEALQSLRAGGGRVTATLPERTTPRVGKLQFVDSAVDAASGTVKVKALFDNKDQALWPGAFVNVKMAVQTLKDAAVVPQATLVQSAGGRSVFVVDTANRAALRPVELLHSAGVDAVVTGVRAGERVILDGRQNVRPGSPVIESAADAHSAARGRAASAPAPGNGASSSATQPAALP
jgi:RND family efflux transporter MFP subunit